MLIFNVIKKDRGKLCIQIGKYAANFAIRPHTIKRSLAPKPSRGLQEVMKDLNLKHAYIIYPGKEKYQLTENITATPLKDLLY